MVSVCLPLLQWPPLPCSCLENPRDGEPGGLLSMGWRRVGHYWSDLAAAAAETGMRWIKIGGSDSERFDSANKPPWKGGEETFWSFSYCSLGLSKRLFKMHIQFSSVAQLGLTLCNPMNHSMPGLPVHHQLLESTQTHVHWVSDAIQPSHPLSSPSPPALNLSQHQGLFKSVSFASGGQSIGISASTSVLPMNTQDWSHLGWTSWISLQSKGLSRVFSNTTVQKHQFFGAQLLYLKP